MYLGAAILALLVPALLILLQLRQVLGPQGTRLGLVGIQASPAERATQLRAVRHALGAAPRLDRGRYPYLPLSDAGACADDRFDHLLRTRNDSDVAINE